MGKVISKRMGVYILITISSTAICQDNKTIMDRINDKAGILIERESFDALIPDTLPGNDKSKFNIKTRRSETESETERSRTEKEINDFFNEQLKEYPIPYESNLMMLRVGSGDPSVEGNFKYSAPSVEGYFKYSAENGKKRVRVLEFSRKLVSEGDAMENSYTVIKNTNVSEDHSMYGLSFDPSKVKRETNSFVREVVQEKINYLKKRLWNCFSYDAKNGVSKLENLRVPHKDSQYEFLRIEVNISDTFSAPGERTTVKIGANVVPKSPTQNECKGEQKIVLTEIELECRDNSVSVTDAKSKDIENP